MRGSIHARVRPGYMYFQENNANPAQSSPSVLTNALPAWARFGLPRRYQPVQATVKETAGCATMSKKARTVTFSTSWTRARGRSPCWCKALRPESNRRSHIAAWHPSGAALVGAGSPRPRASGLRIQDDRYNGASAPRHAAYTGLTWWCEVGNRYADTTRPLRSDQQVVGL